MNAPRPVFVRMSMCQEVFGVHRSTVYRWAQEGLLRIYKRGNISLVRPEDIEAVMLGKAQTSCGTICGAGGEEQQFSV